MVLKVQVDLVKHIDKFIAWFLRPVSGNILVDNISIFENLKKWQENIGYVPQKVFIAEGTLESNIAFGINKEDANEPTKESFKISRLINFKFRC